MKSVPATLLIVLAFAAAPAGAEARASGAPPFLAPAQYDATKVLPPPPAPKSPLAKAEAAELERIQANRTKAAFDAAARDAHNESIKMFAAILGPTFSEKKFPATTKLFSDIAATEEIVSDPAKHYFKRARPYIVDSKLIPCQKKKPPPALNSYPSGHATVAFMMGVVLASLIPDKAQAILARSEQFAENRLVCGVHFRSDIVAGQTFGTLIGEDLLQNAAFKPEYDAAKRELRTAHLAR